MHTTTSKIGLLRPSVDAHSLGLASFASIIEDCGLEVVVADQKICAALNDLDNSRHVEIIKSWIVSQCINAIGFSYRLDPQDGLRNFGKFYHFLYSERLLAATGGLITQVLFGGLPEACRLVRKEFNRDVTVFWGDESPSETLEKVGVPSYKWPVNLAASSAYDDQRFAFARTLLESGEYQKIDPLPYPDYPEFGTRSDSLAARVAFKNKQQLPPLIRSHVGPYQPDRLKAVAEFKQWVKSLASRGLLDILSIGSSQLTQEAFGENWEDRPNGGGVPINSASEFFEIWEAARPMLVRTYSGTRNTLGLARIYEETINNAWHALSLWWFCQTDGRGPYSLLDNLRNHFATIRYIAQVGKPFEPNVPHHFAFRGADDLTYIVSTILAARLAKKLGIQHFVVQNMLNTPKATWGIQDLAKSRAILTLLQPLRDQSFKIYFQTRAGLDYFSHNMDKAKQQLAAVTALMDDIEPLERQHPDIIHVVSFSEGCFLATPEVINESIQITLGALSAYRRLRLEGAIENMIFNDEVASRTNKLVKGATTILRKIEKVIPETYTPEGFYKIFWAGFLPVPQLWGAREEFQYAASWKTKIIDGGCCLVDENNSPLPPEEHADICAELVSKHKFARQLS